jgi:hypothetical protein
MLGFPFGGINCQDGVIYYRTISVHFDNSETVELLSMPTKSTPLRNALDFRNNDDDQDGHRNVRILRTPNAADSPRRLYQTFGEDIWYKVAAGLLLNFCPLKFNIAFMGRKFTGDRL